MKKILIPIDGSEYSERAIETGLEIASLIDCKIVLLRVAEYRTVVSPRTNALMQVPISKIRKEIGSYLKKVKESFGELSEKVGTVILEGDPAGAIIKYLDNSDFDLVIMGSLGISYFMHRLLVGSVTLKVLHSVKQPVLVVK